MAEPIFPSTFIKKRAEALILSLRLSSLTLSHTVFYCNSYVHSHTYQAIRQMEKETVSSAKVQIKF